MQRPDITPPSSLFSFLRRRRAPQIVTPTVPNERTVSGSPLRVIRKALNQLTDHGSQACLDCLEYRRAAMEATEEIHDRLLELEDVLWRIAAPARQDGTYNISRERCEQIAKEALGQTVTKPADSPITRERPRDAGTSGAAT